MKLIAIAVIPCQTRRNTELGKKLMRCANSMTQSIRCGFAKNQSITDEQLKSIDADVKITVTKATEFAQTSPEPKVSELFTDILLPVDNGSQSAEV